MRRFPLFTGIALVAACTAKPTAAPASDRAQIGEWGVDLASMDTTIKPSDDFYRYVNGNWLAKAKIPDDRTEVGSFDDLEILSEQRAIGLLADLAGQDPAKLTPEERKVRDLYAGFIDTVGIEARGMKPAEADIAWFRSLKSLEDVAREMGSPDRLSDTPFGTYFGIDDKHPESYSVNVTQAGLGLPDRDYYLKNDPPLVAAREAYQKYLAAMLTVVRQSDAEKRAAAVYRLEAEIAEVSWPLADRREAEKVYNPMSISDLEKLAPQFPWRVRFQAAGIPLTGPKGERQVIVAEKSAMPKIAAVFAKTPVAVWQDYFITHYMRALASVLPGAVDSINFAFYGKVLNGQQTRRPRSIRGYYRVNSDLGEALGKLYVAKYFPPDAKAKAQLLVDNVRKAMGEDIKHLDWMSDSTKAKALEKLAQFTPKIGYPDHWRDYSELLVDRNDAVATFKNAAIFEYRRELKRLDLPVDRSEWGMTPPTINAYYNANLNEIVFPAAILQPPFFDPKADDAVNYGGIGMVIGHEISHGFDDQGSKYDGTGVLRNWWTARDRKNFDARTAELVKQFNGYEPVPGTRINGQLTLGENIGDLAGETIAAAAYQISLQGKPAPVLNGFTGSQRFYLGFAQAWRSVIRPDALRNQLLADSHSPPEYRVNGSLRNIADWYQSFGIEPGKKNYLPAEKRVRLW